MIFLSKKTKGFTLIELLVVISIIGILSSVVLASLNEARNKASLEAVRQDLRTLANEAAIYYESNGNYADTAVYNGCEVGLANSFIDANSNSFAAITQAVGHARVVTGEQLPDGAESGGYYYCYIYAEEDEWGAAVYVGFISGDDEFYYCIGEDGVFKEVDVVYGPSFGPSTARTCSAS